MKYLLSITLFLFLISDCRADVPPGIKQRFREIIRLIKADKVNELSWMVAYPLTRENPMPDIVDAKAFIAHYPVLFDKAFKKKLLTYNDSIVFEHHGTYGLVGGIFDGDIWINQEGKIAAVNYSSVRENELRNQLTKEIQSKIYPSVNTWKENIVVCKSEKILIRIDNTYRGLRYTSWSKGRPTSEKPDLILYNGVEEAQGTEGGWTWTFKNADWTYVVNDVEMCEDTKPNLCGYSLVLFFKGVEKSTIRLKTIK